MYINCIPDESLGEFNEGKVENSDNCTKYWSTLQYIVQFIEILFQFKLLKYGRNFKFYMTAILKGFYLLQHKLPKIPRIKLFCAVTIMFLLKAKLYSVTKKNNLRQ